MELARGCIIKGPNWPEPVEINHVEEAGGYVRTLGSTTISRLPVDQLISQKELLEVSLLEIGTDFSWTSLSQGSLPPTRCFRSP